MVSFPLILNCYERPVDSNRSVGQGGAKVLDVAA